MTSSSRIRLLLALFLGVSAILNVHDAQADEPENRRDAQADEPEHDLSLTIGPAFVLGLQLDCELKLIPRVSVGLVLGAGNNWSAGIQSRYYVLGNFDHGMPVALQVLAVDLPSAMVIFNGLLGYKKVFGFGLTVDINAGLGLLTSSRVDTAANYPVTLMLNLGVGWSF